MCFIHNSSYVPLELIRKSALIVVAFSHRRAYRHFRWGHYVEHMHSHCRHWNAPTASLNQLDPLRCSDPLQEIQSDCTPLLDHRALIHPSMTMMCRATYRDPRMGMIPMCWSKLIVDESFTSFNQQNNSRPSRTCSSWQSNPLLSFAAGTSSEWSQELQEDWKLCIEPLTLYFLYRCSFKEDRFRYWLEWQQCVCVCVTLLRTHQCSHVKALSPESFSSDTKASRQCLSVTASIRVVVGAGNESDKSLNSSALDLLRPSRRQQKQCHSLSIRVAPWKSWTKFPALWVVPSSQLMRLMRYWRHSWTKQQHYSTWIVIVINVVSSSLMVLLPHHAAGDRQIEAPLL